MLDCSSVSLLPLKIQFTNQLLWRGSQFTVAGYDAQFWSCTLPLTICTVLGDGCALLSSSWCKVQYVQYEPSHAHRKCTQTVSNQEVGNDSTALTLSSSLFFKQVMRISHSLEELRKLPHYLLQFILLPQSLQFVSSYLSSLLHFIFSFLPMLLYNFP